MVRSVVVSWSLPSVLRPTSRFEPIGQNLQMVARQRQLAAEHGLDGPELGVGSVVAGRGRLVVADLNLVDDADDVFSRVSVGVAHHHQQGWLGADEAGFLLEFPYGCMKGVFTLVNKTTWKRPSALHWGVFSLNQQDGVPPPDSGVCSQRRVEPAVAFVAGRHLTHRSGAHVPGRFEWP